MMSALLFRREAYSFLLASLIAAAPAAANQTESVTHEGVRGFLEGEFVNVALTSSGELVLAPEAKSLASLDEPIVWTALPDGEGGFYLGTGNKGKVYRLSGDGELTPVFEPEQVLSRALAVGPDGALYVGTSPEGKVYRIVPESEPEVFFEPEQHYIWDIVFDGEGRMYVATGAEGHIYRMLPDYEPGDAVELFFQSEQTHISTLAWDAEGRLLAGTSPGGLVYRFDEEGGAFAILNTGDREIRRIIADEDGTLFVAAFTGDAAGTAAPARPTGTIANVIAAILGTGDGDSENDNSRQQGPQTPGSGARVGTIYRVDPEGYFEPYWMLPGYAIHSMALLPDGQLLVGTGTQGRVFSVTGPGEWKLLQRLESGGEVSMVATDPEGGTAVYAFTSNPAEIYHMDFTVASNGRFTSKVYDAGQVARWGRFHLDASDPGVRVSARSGNTEEPEQTWSDWTEAASPEESVSTELPAARYFQYRLLFDNDAEEGDALDIRANRARFFYRKFNAAPVVSAIRLVPADVALERVPASPQTPSIDLDQLFTTNNNQASRQGSRQERSGQLRVHERPGLATIAWQATDPNGGPLSFILKIRAEGEEHWTILAEDLRDNFLSFNTQGFDEGRYHAKVIASDHLANPPGTARTAARVSEAFVIDNTAPVIEVLETRINGNSAGIRIAAEDSISLITDARYYLNGGERIPLFPEDGFFDSRRETFQVDLNGLSSGRHSLIVVAEDEAGNERVRTIHFEVD